jgi:hypothetical protein
MCNKEGHFPDLSVCFPTKALTSQLEPPSYQVDCPPVDIYNAALFNADM